MFSAEMLMKGDATTPRKQRLKRPSFSSSPPPSPSKRFNSSHRTTATAAPLSLAAVGLPATGRNAAFSKNPSSPDNTIKLPLAHQSLIIRKYLSNGGVTVGALDRFLNTELKIVLTDYDDVDVKDYMNESNGGVRQAADNQIQSQKDTLIQPDELLLLISDIVTGERRRRNKRSPTVAEESHPLPSVGQSPTKKITWGEGAQRADPLLLNEVGHNGFEATFFSSSSAILSPSSCGQTYQYQGLVQPRRTASDLTEAALSHLHKELSPRSHSKSQRRKRKQQKRRRDEERKERANKQGGGLLKNECSNDKNNNNAAALVELDSSFSSGEDSVSSSSIARFLLPPKKTEVEETFSTQSHFSRSIVFKKILPALRDKRGAALAANAFVEALQEEQMLEGDRRGSEFWGGEGASVKAPLPLHYHSSSSSSDSSDDDIEEEYSSSSDDHDDKGTSSYDTIARKRKGTVYEASKKAAAANSREALRNFLKPVGGRDGRTIIGAFRAIGAGGRENYNSSASYPHPKKAREKSLLILAALSDSDRYDYQELRSHQLLQQQQAFAGGSGAGGNYSSYGYSSNSGGKPYLAKHNGGGGSATASGSAVTDRTLKNNSETDGQNNAAHPSTFEEKLSQLERLLLGDDAEEDIEELYPITASEIAAKCDHHGLPHGTASQILERLDPHRQGLVTFSTFKEELLKDCKKINLMPPTHLLMVHGHHHGDAKRIDEDDDRNNSINALAATTAAPQQAVSVGGGGAAMDIGRTNSTFGLSVQNAETATSTSRSARASDTTDPRPQDSLLLPTTVGGGGANTTAMNASSSSSQLVVASVNKGTSVLIHEARRNEKGDYMYSVSTPPPPPLSPHKSKDKDVLEKSETVVPNPPIGKTNPIANTVRSKQPQSAGVLTTIGARATPSSAYTGHMFLIAELVAHCYPFCIERLCGRRVLELLLSTSALLGGTRGGSAALLGSGRGPVKPSINPSLLWNSTGSEDKNKLKKTKAKTKKGSGSNQHGHNHEQQNGLFGEKTTDQHKVGGDEEEIEDEEDEEEAKRKKAQEELAALVRTATIEGRPVNMKAKRRLYFATLPRYMLPRIADDEHSLNCMERVHYRRQRVLRKRILRQEEQGGEQPENSQKKGRVRIELGLDSAGSGHREGASYGVTIGGKEGGVGDTKAESAASLRHYHSPCDKNRLSATGGEGDNTTSMVPMRGSRQLMESLRSPFFTTPKLFGARVQAGTALVPCAPPTVLAATAQRLHQHEKGDEKAQCEERTTPRRARRSSSPLTSEALVVVPYGSRPLACRTTPRPCTAREWTDVVEKGRGQSREHSLTELYSIQPATAQHKNGGLPFLTQKTSSHSSHGDRPVTGDSNSIRKEVKTNPSSNNCWAGGVSPRKPATSGSKQRCHHQEREEEKRKVDEETNPLLFDNVDGTNGNEKADFTSDSVVSLSKRPHTCTSGASSARYAPHLPKPHPPEPPSSTSLPQARSVYSARVKRNHYGLTAANALYPLGNKKREHSEKDKENYEIDNRRSSSVSGSNTTVVRADPDLEESQTPRDTTASISRPERKPFVPRPPHLLGRGEKGGAGNNNNNSGGSVDGRGEKFESLVKGMLSEHGIRTHH